MSSLVTYEIDASDVIRSVGGAWTAFAQENGGAHLSTSVVGRPLLGYIAGPSTQHMYAMLIARARTGRVMEFPYRCDSPQRRRYMRMRMSPLSDGAVRFESEALITQSWPAAHQGAARPRPAGEILRLCSWCKRGEVDREWVDPEVVVEQMGMFIGDTERMISHAICPSCAVDLQATLDASRGRPSP